MTTPAWTICFGFPAILAELIPLRLRNRMQNKEAPGGPEASQRYRSALQRMSGHPFLRLEGDIHEGLNIVEPK